MPLSVSVTTAPGVSVHLGTLMGINTRACPTHVRYAPLSGHHSRRPLPIPQERKCYFNVARSSILIIITSFGKGIYTSSASNKYVPFTMLEVPLSDH